MKSILVASALLLGSIASQASTVSGYLSAAGTDQFTSSTITFGTASVGGAIGGDFATYLKMGTPINFLPGTLPYKQGMNQSLGSPVYAALGYVPLFSVSNNGETFLFDMTSYSAAYITDQSFGCAAGSVCLNMSGGGYFVASGPLTGQSGPASFAFTSQYVPGSNVGTMMTTFSASASALPGTPAGAPAPEPESLALLGTGLLTVFGIARRRLKV